MTRTQRPADYTTKNIWESCGKCEGTGSVSWGIDVDGAVHLVNSSGETVGRRTVSKVCFTCNGVGGKRASQAQLDRREYGRKYRARKAEEKAAAKRAEVAAKEAAEAEKFAAWKSENAELVEFVDGAQWGEPGTFMWDMKFRIFTEERALTENQTKAIRGIMERAAREAAESSPVVEGRVVITGKVLSVKERFSAYGSVLKITVKDDRGFRVWGTLPSAIAGQGCTGRRVTFTATVETSDDDPAFGFFKRPTKAALLDD